MYTYLLVDLFAFVVPFLVSFHPKNGFIKHYKQVFGTLLIVAVFFIVWDVFFTNLTVWGFTPEYLTGLYFINLPIEEVLFFIFIPYSCLFTLYVFKDNKLIPNVIDNLKKYLTYLIAAFSLGMSIVFYNNAYTLFTFSWLFVVLSYIIYKKKYNTFYELFLVYIILMIPFVLVNGVLTGSFFNRVVVWYNPNHIIGFRILTIPFEDIFYGLLLVTLNAYLLEYKITRKAKQLI